MIAVTLFLVVINSVLRVLPAGLYILVYADDIHLLATGKHPKIIRRRLQPAVTAVGGWAERASCRPNHIWLATIDTLAVCAEANKYTPT